MNSFESLQIVHCIATGRDEAYVAMRAATRVHISTTEAYLSPLEYGISPSEENIHTFAPSPGDFIDGDLLSLSMGSKVGWIILRGSFLGGIEASRVERIPSWIKCNCSTRTGC